MSDLSPSPIPGARTRILVADDHDHVRGGLRELFTAHDDFELVGEAADGSEAAMLAASLEPDVVLMDVSMPVMGGIEATTRIVARNSRIRVIVLTALHGLERAAYEAGAIAHVGKDAPPHELLDCVRRAVA